MLAGAAATIVSLLALAWTREIVGGLLGLFGAKPEDEGVKITIIVVAVAFVYILDFSINTIQAAIRAFMVDCSPTHQQDAANAMASRMTGIGNIIGYMFGYINLPKYMWFFGDSQFKVLCVIASLALGSTVLISTGLVKERDPRLEGPPNREKGGILSFFKSVVTSIKRLPPQTRKVCEVQFFAWIGWFGFLFYLSTWVAELYVEPIVEKNPDLTPDEIDKLYEKGTRIGTAALLAWATASLASNILLPFFIAPMYDGPVIPSSASIAPSMRSGRSDRSYTTRIDRFLASLVIPWLTLRRAWTIGLVMFAVTMWSTLLIRTTTMATIVVTIVGIPWSLTIWAPFAIISAEISKRDALRRAQALNLTSRSDNNSLADLGDDNVDQAGIILGIHNVAIAAPQVIATLGSSVIFRFLQKPRGTPGDLSMPVVLAIGGVFAAIAAIFASRLQEDKPVESLEAPRPTTSSSRHHRRQLSRTQSFGNGLTY
jgi:solute carrier family 45 protein 1/2/4